MRKSIRSQFIACSLLLFAEALQVRAGVAYSDPPGGWTYIYNGDQLTNLAANTIYSGQLVVSDQAGRSSTNKFSFDTFVESSGVLVEAEDFKLPVLRAVHRRAETNGSKERCQYRRVMESSQWHSGSVR